MKAKKYYEAKHNLKYSKTAIEKCVDLSIKYIPENSLPDKALDLMDYTGSMFSLKGKQKVATKEVEKSLTRLRKINIEVLKEKKKDAEYVPLGNLIKSKIFGQDAAIDSVTKVIERSQAGLKEADKPIASFLCVGPTGVGKTELAKQLADNLKYGFTRLDMSEYGEQHTASSLLGSPQGYVGDEGLLVKSMEDNPQQVLLLDEMEKAHPSIQQIFLQVMDNGKAKTRRGTDIDFSNAVIIMTSNAGAATSQKKTVGLSSSFKTQAGTQELKNYFLPEFLGRLDGVVNFNRLGDNVVKEIVIKFVKDLSDLDGMKKNKLTLGITDAALDNFISRGYSPEYGARNLKRLVKAEILDLLTPVLLDSNLEQDREVIVDFEENKLVLK